MTGVTRNVMQQKSSDHALQRGTLLIAVMYAVALDGYGSCALKRAPDRAGT